MDKLEEVQHRATDMVKGREHVMHDSSLRKQA